jgi:hypothetical protein
VDVQHSSATVFVYIFVGLMILGAIFLFVTVLRKPLKGKLSINAAHQYGEDLTLVIELVTKEMVPRFPHMSLEELVPLVMSAVSTRTGTNAKLYEITIRHSIMRHRGDPDAPPPSSAAPGETGITRWTD